MLHSVKHGNKMWLKSFGNGILVLNIHIPYTYVYVYIIIYCYSANGDH